MGLTVTQLSFDFGGSNPSLPTKHFAEVAQSIEH